MNLSSTDFELFDIQPCFALDRAALDARWRVLQGEVHPDKFAVEGPAAQRVAMQWAVRVNEAYQRLKDPVRRAAYLCELNGAPIEAESNTAMPTVFLMQQMEWRESLDDAATVAQVEALADEVSAHRKTALAHLESTLDEQHDFLAAAQQVRALMFSERFAHDIDQASRSAGTISPWPSCKFPNPAAHPIRTSAASRSASISVPRIRWLPRRATAWPSACPTKPAA